MEPSTATRPIPLACSLEGEERVERGQLFRSIAAAGLQGVEARGAELDFKFHSGPDLRRSLERLVVLEGECCPSLEFAFSERNDVLTLTVRSPQGSSAVLDTIRAMLVA